MSTQPQGIKEEDPLSHHTESFGALRPRIAYPLVFFVVAFIGFQFLPVLGHAGGFLFSVGSVAGKEVDEASETLSTELLLPVPMPSESGFFFSPLVIQPLGLSVDDPEVFIDDELFDEEGNFFYASLAPSPRAPSARENPAILSHTVNAQENLSTIAAQYGVSVNSLIWANAKLQQNPDLLQQGEVLVIPPVSGVLHKVHQGETVEAIAKKYQADPAKIIAFNWLPADGALKADATLVVPDGKIPSPPAPKYTPQYKGDGSGKLVSAGYFVRPVAGGRRVRGLSRYHRGVDIGIACGTPVHASAGGTVVRADGVGWNGGFGKVVVIQHPNGTQTLYAHNSSLRVTNGTPVSQGNVIALSGTTGRSTGCHVHFEVHGAKNPF